MNKELKCCLFVSLSPHKAKLASSGGRSSREIARNGHKVGADGRKRGTSRVKTDLWVRRRHPPTRLLERTLITLHPHGRLGIAILADGRGGRSGQMIHTSEADELSTSNHHATLIYTQALMFISS